MSKAQFRSELIFKEFFPKNFQWSHSLNSIYFQYKVKTKQNYLALNLFRQQELHRTQKNLWYFLSFCKNQICNYWLVKMSFSCDKLKNKLIRVHRNYYFLKKQNRFLHHTKKCLFIEEIRKVLRFLLYGQTLIRKCSTSYLNKFSWLYLFKFQIYVCFLKIMQLVMRTCR